MVKGFIAVELDFPDVVYFFAPRPNQQKYSTYPKRQKLRGKLRLVTGRPIKLNRVEIRFKGCTHLSWRDPFKSTHSILAERMHGCKTLRKSKSVLLQDATIPSGITEMGFELTIPGNLCSSFSNDFCDISHKIYAIVVPTGKFTKEIHVEREIKVCKTLMPRDVVYGYVDGYRVPRLMMHGERPGLLAWEFQVPRWACLEEETLEFNGVLHTHPSSSYEWTIERIQVDVVQEEIYRDETMNSKRHLVISNNTPSTYLHPPLDTPISFSFPLQQQQELNNTLPSVTSTPQPGQLRRVVSVPTYLSGMGYQPTSKRKTISPNGKVTLLSHGSLTYSLDSPFLEIRHFIRLIIHVAGESPPICIGLPFQITPFLNLREDQQSNDDGLPTYQSIYRDEERLPDYVSSLSIAQNNEIVEEEEEVDESPPPPQQQASSCCLSSTDTSLSSIAPRPLRRNHQYSSSQPYGLQLLAGSTSIASLHHTAPVTHCGSLAEERTLDDFWLHGGI
ncbi:predicted protein [Lichtheimia corymbifera JMRC:FSU:9682]|uniref:Arrestin-like N-terminal domain-containing protein n=1 Tax=Lichtheimia corymbifera JMRC:FSU:9682 TaxID=1263082 RepID=A0A068SF97_9FUNG|nr:predicted protein [Lichtheimia corymbifera JMRC:FSU:9682]